MDEELIKELKRQEQTRKDDYKAGYEKGWKDGVADLLKKQDEIAEAEQRRDEEAEDYREK